MKLVQSFTTIVVLALSPITSWACSSCGCTLSTAWENSTQTGFKLDLRYDYINQNQLRSGTSTISSGAASLRKNGDDPQEVESYTENRYLTATGEYTISPDWKASLALPYIIRHHSTLGVGSDGTTPADGAYTSNTSDLGDVKLLGHYQGFSPEHNIGLIFGLKLPTGIHDLHGTSTNPVDGTPAAIDRGLQPGTGTIDLILGASYIQPLNKNWDYFSEGLFQSALNSAAQYRPGNGYNLNLGLRYLGLEALTPEIQLNTRYVQADSGDNADKISTGGTLIYLSPGVIVPVYSKLEAYGFVQVPLYQNLLGVQLAPTYTASLGARYMF